MTQYDPLKSSGPGKDRPPPPSYWHIQTEPPQAYPALGGDRSVDVAIIGGGYTGLAAAYFLAGEYGVEPLVLEANSLGWGASGRNAGFALRSTGRLAPGAMEKRWGTERTRQTLREFDRGLDEVERVLEQSGTDCDRQPPGFIKVIHRDGLIEEAREAAEHASSRYGVESRFLGREELSASFLRSNSARAGILYSRGFCLNPMLYLKALARLTHEAGATICTGTEVIRWEKQNGSHLLVTSDGSVKAKNVIIASNAYTPKRFHRGFDKRTLPVLTSVLVTSPTPSVSSEDSGIHTHQGIMDTRKLKYYYRKLPDGRVLFGGRGAIRGADADNPIYTQRLLKALHEMFPSYSETTADYSWNGWITISLDDVPRVTHTEEDPSVWYASGFSGCGMAFTTRAGHLLAQGITGTLEDPSIPFLASPLKRFPLAPFRRIGQGLYYQYGRIMDALQ